MIVFKKIIIKNFMSAGNAPIVIDYTKAKSTIVTAVNGSGKSSLFQDSICFALYGRAYRNITKPQLINSINQKNMLVEIEFNVDKDNYTVKRGMKPNIFEIYKNGKMLNQDAASRDYQKILEQSILKMNYRTFTQVVIMGSGNFVPFMRLSTASRREFIEDILDIKIFSMMNVLLKQMIKDHLDSITILEEKLAGLKDKVAMQQSFINTLDEQNQFRTNAIINEITKLQKEIGDHFAAIEHLQLDIEQRQSLNKDDKKMIQKMAELKTIRSTIEANLKRHEENKILYSSTDICPTCKQSIEDHHKKKLIGGVDSKLIQLNDGIQEIDNKLEEIKIDLREATKINQGINELLTLVAQHNYSVTVAQKMIEKLTNDKNNLSQQSSHEEKLKLKAFANDILKAEKDRKNKINDTSYYDAIQAMLKDTGIKTRIIKQYIPIFNKLINQFLQKLELFVEFTIDENFNESVKSRYRDSFTYDSFSEGEKMRIDLALLFVFREIARLKNAVNCNLLILDEVLDTSMDAAGVDNFFNIINDLSNTNLIVISHREGIQDRFEANIKLIKQGNFTIVDKK